MHLTFCMAFAIRSHFLSSICGESSISCLRVSVILRLSCLLDTSLNTLGWAAKRLFSSAVSSWKNWKKIENHEKLYKRKIIMASLFCSIRNTVILEKLHWNFYYVWISGRAYSWVPNRCKAPNKCIGRTFLFIKWQKCRRNFFSKINKRLVRLFGTLEWVIYSRSGNFESNFHDFFRN